MPKEESLSAPFDDLDSIKQIDQLGRQIVGVVRAETLVKPETHSVGRALTSDVAWSQCSGPVKLRRRLETMERD